MQSEPVSHDSGCQTHMAVLFVWFVSFSYLNRGADDRAAFLGFMKELRLAFEGEAVSNKLPRLLLTAAVPASPEAIAAG